MIGERIRLGRAMKRLSMRGLAEDIGVSAQSISKYERNLMVPSSGVLMRLAEVLDVELEFFFRARTVAFDTLEFRKKSTLSKKCERSVTSKVSEWLERYLEVEDLVYGGASSSEVQHLQVPVSSLGEVEERATRVREAWSIGARGIGDLTELLEDRNIKVGLVDAPAKFDACMVYMNEHVPVIVVNQNMPGDRQRFSMAHELGHAMLKPVGGLDQERVASRFAGAFLVPADAARHELGARRNRVCMEELHLLKHKYGMSMQAWIYRARDLDIISQTTAVKLFRSFRQQGWHIREPGRPVPGERPRRLERLVWRIVAEGGISQARAEELLGKPLPCLK